MGCHLCHLLTEERDYTLRYPRHVSGKRVARRGISPKDMHSFRAYAVVADGTARELEYSAGVRHGKKGE